jgi:hypothetical protein
LVSVKFSSSGLESRDPVTRVGGGSQNHRLAWIQFSAVQNRNGPKGKKKEDAPVKGAIVGCLPLGGGLPASRHGKIARCDDEDHGDRRDPIEGG